MDQETEEEIRELSVVISLLEIEKLTQGYRRQLLIQDSQIESFRNLEQEYLKVLAEMKVMVDQLRALHQINMRLLNIVNAPPKAREKKWQETDSSQSRMLKQFAQNTR